MPARLLDGSCLFLLIASVAAGTSAAAQTDVGFSAYWTFSRSTSGNNTNQTPTYTAGGMVEFRHITNPFVGYEAAYAFNGDNQSYVAITAPAGPPTAVISANAREITGAWIFSVKPGNLTPFALAGAGVLMVAPTSGTFSPCGISLNPPCGVLVNPPTNTSVEPVFVYGAGIDCGISRHIGLRVQYRGNLTKAAALTPLIRSSGALIHIAEPVFGGYFRF